MRDQKAVVQTTFLSTGKIDLQIDNKFVLNQNNVMNQISVAAVGRGVNRLMNKLCVWVLLGTMLCALSIKVSAQEGWNFVYNGDVLPQSLIDDGRTDWQNRETGGTPFYESIVSTHEAQVGGLWRRFDDNAVDTNFPDFSTFADGFNIATDLYNQWNGSMTFVMRVRDLGTDSQKSVVDISNSAGNYFTLGHVQNVGWEFGQTNDGRNANGLSDVQTGGLNQFVVIRITVEDDTPGDGASTVRGWQNGKLVYESARTDDISVGEFGDIAFRRTSGGGEQKMEIDWIVLNIGNAWAPGSGPKTPAGARDGVDANAVSFKDSKNVNGAVGLDSKGAIRTVRDQSIPAGLSEVFTVDENGVPSQFDIFFFGFDAYRDLETVENDNGDLTGVIGLDKFAGVHGFRSVMAPGLVASGPGLAVSEQSGNPQFDYLSDAAAFNASNPATPVTLPYFPFEIAIDTPNDGVGRDLELAIDWRTATNAFQGYYILDAFAGVHYVSNAETLNFLNRNLGPAGNNTFRDIFGFRPIYTSDYAGRDSNGNTLTKPAPYFMFSGGTGLPIAKDLEVMARFEKITNPTVADSNTRSQLAATNGIDENKLFQPIAIPETRLNIANRDFAADGPVTSGYAILDGFGAVHSMLEDENGSPIPAPWENVDTGGADPSVDAPYFANPPFDDGNDFNIAIDLELMPNGQGYCLLTRLGEVFVVNAVGTTAKDNFEVVGIELNLPFFGFDAARSLELVANEEGKIIGMYVLDRFGTVHSVGQVPRINGSTLFFRGGFSNDLELSPKPGPITAPSSN